MPRLLATHLTLARCPHCNVDNPNLPYATQLTPTNYQGVVRYWRVYVCARCAGAISACAPSWDHEIQSMFPSTRDTSEDIPTRARAYLDQSINSLSSPAGSVMLAASSVDAMLKAKGLLTGTLYTRIDEAAKQHMITSEMATWAHEVRLDANDQRHSDELAPLPDQSQAEKCVEFATALAQFLFVLPARIERGIRGAQAN